MFVVKCGTVFVLDWRTFVAVAYYSGEGSMRVELSA